MSGDVELKGAGQHRGLSLEVGSPWCSHPSSPKDQTCLSPAWRAPGVTGKGKEGQREALGGDRLQSQISMGVLPVHTPFTEVRKIPYWEQFLHPCRAGEH